MGIFDFFKKKNKYNHDEILEDTIDIKDINEEITFLRTDIDSSKEYCNESVLLKEVNLK